jgi:hypothetical protein
MRSSGLALTQRYVVPLQATTTRYMDMGRKAVKARQLELVHGQPELEALVAGQASSYEDLVGLVKLLVKAELGADVEARCGGGVLWWPD